MSGGARRARIQGQVGGIGPCGGTGAEEVGEVVGGAGRGRVGEEGLRLPRLVAKGSVIKFIFRPGDGNKRTSAQKASPALWVRTSSGLGGVARLTGFIARGASPE